ncbi:MAG TPA: rhamnulokinase family protein [Bryobacteraceae bacterium]|jgi:rhamnulokinase|nr:rhamnulokinase family protein [Bryobacteraceae bacterium]
MTVNQFLAIDLGAESGRAMLGTLENGKLSLEELHRFPNTAVRLPTGLYWDTLRLFYEIRRSLEICGRRRGVRLQGIGIDTWGVDFALLGSDGALVDNPRHYRDARNAGMLEKTFAVIPREEIFAETGVQLMAINSLYQLYAMKLAASPALASATRLLFIPDLLNYWLTGVPRAEQTIASTSQFYNPRTRTWATTLFDRLGLPTSILPEIVAPGTRIGNLLPEIAETSGFDAPVPVYATACHDTASAVAAVPVSGDKGWCYISSGTWSLLGAEIDAPIVNDRALELNFTNEMGADGKVRLLKNIAGLWLLQECRRAWALEGKEYSYADLAAMAEAAPPSRLRIDPDEFLSPGNMPEQIAGHCRERGERAPEDPGAFCRLILESLAESYTRVLHRLESLLGRPIDVVHIVGGGSRNRLLNQLTADFSGKTVVAGPTEATAAGNILVQALGAGVVSGLSEVRAITRASFDLETFVPKAKPGAVASR